MLHSALNFLLLLVGLLPARLQGVLAALLWLSGRPQAGVAVWSQPPDNRSVRSCLPERPSRRPRITPRYRDDPLRQRTARSHCRSTTLMPRLLAAAPAWEHVVLLLDGPDDNPYNPHTTAAVRYLIRRCVGAEPAVVKVERSSRLAHGGLHVHLVVPCAVARKLPRRETYVTPDGVIVRTRLLGRHLVTEGSTGLTRLLRYLHKPAHAGATWFRATGEQHPKYLAAQAAVAAGQRMHASMGRRGLPRTLWTQHLPRLPPSRPAGHEPIRMASRHHAADGETATSPAPEAALSTTPAMPDRAAPIETSCHVQTGCPMPSRTEPSDDRFSEGMTCRAERTPGPSGSRHGASSTLRGVWQATREWLVGTARTMLQRLRN